VNKLEHDNGANEYKKIIFEDVCPVEVKEEIKIEQPFKIRARADVGEIRFECKGHTIEKEHCKHHATDKFKVIQRIHICIPIKFEAEIDIGKEHVEFELKEDCN
jgi:hypothetical protein